MRHATRLDSSQLTKLSKLGTRSVIPGSISTYLNCAEKGKFLRCFGATLEGNKNMHYRFGSLASLLFTLQLLMPLAVDAATGRTAGAFDVSPIGAATYAIPIWTPPGTGGIQPDLALTYNSRSGRDLLGPGWSLSGLSSIARCNATYAQDTVPAAVTFTFNDRFCLNGNKLRLTGGTYGYAGSTYQTEIADFSSITAYGATGNGPAYFFVKGRSGLMYEYGNTTDSRVATTPTSTPYEWTLNKISDPSGNSMVVTYAQSDGSFVPISIQYSRTSSTSTTYSYEVAFTYVTRSAPDAQNYYLFGEEINKAKQITTIEIRSSGALARKYSLSYSASTSTGLQRLATVQECGGSAGTDCLQPTVISYQNGQAGVGSPTTSAGTGEISPIDNENVVDINGDGRTDLIYKASSRLWVKFGQVGGGLGPAIDTGITPAYSDPFLIDDFDGDGMLELLWGQSGTWLVYRWNGNAFIQSSIGLSTDVNRAGNSRDVASADVNGDGLPDLVTLRNDGKIYRRLNTSSAGSVSFAPSQTLGFDLAAAYSQYVTMQYVSNQIYGGNSTHWSQSVSSVKHKDFDGDGREDLIVFLQRSSGSGGAWFKLMSTTTGFSGPSTMAFDSYNYGWVPVNWNDDACTDIVPLSTGSNSNTIVIVSACGAGSSVVIGFYGPTSHDTNYVMLDWNGDGRTDLLGKGPGGTLLAFCSVGNGASSAISTGLPIGNGRLMPSDQDGDGLHDLVFFDSNAGWAASYGLHNGAGTPPDLVSSISDGFGVYVSPTYVSIAQNNYSKHSDATYPDQDFAKPFYVVNQFSASDGIGGTYTNQFWYYGARRNLQGRGFEGFYAKRTYDSRNGLYGYQYYRRDFPYTGATFQSDVYQSNGTTLLRRIEHAFATTTLESTINNQRYFPYPSSSTVKSYEYDADDPSNNGRLISTATTNYTFDSSGNTINVIATATDNDGESPYNGLQWSSTTVKSISPQPGCLGLATQVSVTNTAPGVPSLTRTTSYTPDYAKCRPTQEIVEPSSGTYKITSDIGYDTFGNVNSTTITGIGMTARTIGVYWGTTGQFPVSITNPLNQTTQMGYDYNLGVQNSQTDSNLLSIGWGYDNFARKTSEIRPDGTSTSWAYEDCSTAGCFNGNHRMTLTQTLRNVDSSVLTDEITYLDQFDRPLAKSQRQMDGSRNRIETRYDAFGRVGQQSAPCAAASCTLYWSTLTYDVLNRVVLQARPRSATIATLQSTFIEYRGRTTIVTDAEGKTTTKISTVAGTPGRSQDDNGYYQNFSHDAFGSLLSVSDSLANSLFTATYDYGAGVYQRTASDMDLGARSYTYNALGELTNWSDAKGQTFSGTYDLLSRPLTRVEPGVTTSWTWGNNAAIHNIGQLERITVSGYEESYTYDNRGRLSNRQIVSDATYAYDYSYHSTTGLLDALTYPTSTSSYRLKLQYLYQNGVMQQVKDYNSATIFWQATEANPRGQFTKNTLGNGVVTERTIDAVTGWVSNIKSGVGGGAVLQNESYLFDRIGNVTQRQNGNLGLTENFYYDDLYRLDYSMLGSTTNLDLAYDAMGNITSRSDVAAGATWTYHSTKKHAVTQAGSSNYTYSYDPNGNAITRNGYLINWTSYNYPSLINGPGKTLTFSYGPDRQRYQQVYTNGSTTETTMYIGGPLEKVTSGGVTDWRHYVSAGGSMVAVISRQSTGTNTTRYILEDHQGSIAQIAESNGVSFVSESFTAFGARRDANSWSGPCPCPDLAKIKSVTRMGYTGQEAIGGVSMGLNHMNGRVQDAITGRFLSPDPYITEPGNTQNFNRYSYVNNNPLSYADPSGFCRGQNDPSPVADDRCDSGGGWSGGDGSGSGGSDGGIGGIGPGIVVPGIGTQPGSYWTTHLSDGSPTTFYWAPEATNCPSCFLSQATASFSEPASAPAGLSGGGLGGSTVDRMLAAPSAQRMNAYFDAALNGDWDGAVSAGFEIIKGEWRDAYSTPEGALLTTMSMVPIVGMEAAATRGALAAPRQIAASWGSSVYRHGGLMTGIEHIIYRHGFGSGFSGVSRFAQGTRLRDISNYVDSALRYGRVTPSYPGASMVEYNVGRAIGTDVAGNATSNIRIYIRDGVIQTAFPF